MTSPIRITRLGRGRSPVFSAEWNGKPLTIHMDSSAVMKLQGKGSVDEIDDAFAESSSRITDAAQRLLEMRQTESDEQGVVVVISALDLD